MATTITKTETLVGKRIRRREDPRLITGTATYVDDIQMPGMHHACIVRSPHGAANIKSINVKPALETPGVVAVFTGRDTEAVGPVPCGASLPGLRVPHHHILAIDHVYFIGHPVAGMLGIPENHLHVITPEVGGGFGSKLNVYAEEALMGFVAMKIGKPVKWIESRRENFMCTIHGRGHVDYYEVAAKRDGTITGIKLKLIQDLGAYHQLLTPAIPTLSVLMMPGLYKCQNVRADIVGAFTNAVPTDAYRGAGRPEATHGIERMVDILATELKMDPAEISYKNFASNEQFPK